MSDTIRVLLVDDHAVLRAGLHALLDAEDERPRGAGRPLADDPHTGDGGDAVLDVWCRGCDRGRGQDLRRHQAERQQGAYESVHPPKLARANARADRPIGGSARRLQRTWRRIAGAPSTL